KLLADLRVLLGQAAPANNKSTSTPDVDVDGKTPESAAKLERETSTASTTVSSSSSSSAEPSPRHADASSAAKLQAVAELREPHREPHAEGLEQSPIDICALDSELVLQDDEQIEVVLSDEATQVRIVHSGANFRVDWVFEEGEMRSCIKIQGKTYYAVQFHFHAPSEHTLGGKHEAMELHLVHQASDGSLAVVGLFFREGKENEFLAQFWDEIPEMPTDGTKVTANVSAKVSAASLRLLEGKFFRYRGSLTTPPYSEGVQWVVLADVAEASAAQLARYVSAIPRANARDVQPRNHRLVTLRQCGCGAP
ncbi:Carbonic anhydrase, partial [Globisporangium polare]